MLVPVGIAVGTSTVTPFLGLRDPSHYASPPSRSPYFTIPDCLLTSLVFNLSSDRPPSKILSRLSSFSLFHSLAQTLISTSNASYSSQSHRLFHALSFLSLNLSHSLFLSVTLPLPIFHSILLFRSVLLSLTHTLSFFFLTLLLSHLFSNFPFLPFYLFDISSHVILPKFYLSFNISLFCTLSNCPSN